MQFLYQFKAFTVTKYNRIFSGLTAGSGGWMASFEDQLRHHHQGFLLSNHYLCDIVTIFREIFLYFFKKIRILSINPYPANVEYRATS
jgi:hypothetical protein